MTTIPDPDTIKSLVSRLTVEQKIAQVTGFPVTDLFVPGGDTGFRLDPGRLPELRPHGVGHLSLSWYLGRDADSLKSALDGIQQSVRDLSPFGMGALVHNEAINGFLHPCAEQFPTAWSQAATWNPDLTERIAATAAADMRRTGVHLAFAPVMDLNRDPRWGRVHETYGEDPELAAQFSVAFVRGIQDEDGGASTLAVGKHFLGYGASEGGLNQATTQLGRRALVDDYAEPFRRAIAEAGLYGVMNSYNDIDGLPVAASHWVLTELLREQLGFEGLAVSDYDSVNLLRHVFHTATTPGRAGAQAIAAGLDVELPGDTNYSHLAEEIEAGRLDESVLDRAVARVLTVKARLGLIPDVRTQRPAQPAGPQPAEATELRRTVASESLVLLQNDGTLPLPPQGITLAVTGPAADDLRIHFGAYTSVAHDEVPTGMRALKEGRVPGVDPATFVFTDIFQARFPGDDSVFAGITRNLHPDTPTVLHALRDRTDSVVHVPLGSFEDDGPLDAQEVDAAVAEADVVVAVVGERTGWVGNNTAGEGQSTAHPRLPGNQEELLELLARTGKPLVTVVVSGRPLVLTGAARASRAVLLAPLLGEAAADAVTGCLLGDINPSGKLPSTFPRDIGQLPLYHGHLFGSGYGHPTGTRHGYNDLPDVTPLYAFGHGLSYSTFEAAFDETDGPAVEQRGDRVRARFRVTNTSDVAGTAVLQMYARDEDASVVRPVRRLLAFTRVPLAGGQSTSVLLEAPLERLFYTLPDGHRGLESGDVTIMGAFASDDIRCAATLPLSGADASGTQYR
ncbi:beta-glucosidase family protein [Streptomyces lomondensis]|uniref:Glycosyl hydrolase n=1 Tax=Streptomyces lomondensis TaxID=68229 RepID=A0ABQ2XRL5_9ACTN|nr:glycoside hydrolase family 3 N-terminal domain-containing protein [Streptomyces lomondensis]MCF0080872.1 glycoside hydrolase family 3 C-terminal domain-containing protein [Streptomyces lomondensis]GGX30936.1 glycosyl hydrolase [Streptomyces lomondensis]